MPKRAKLYGRKNTATVKTKNNYVHSCTRGNSAEFDREKNTSKMEKRSIFAINDQPLQMLALLWKNSKTRLRPRHLDSKYDFRKSYRSYDKRRHASREQNT